MDSHDKSPMRRRSDRFAAAAAKWIGVIAAAASVAALLTYVYAAGREAAATQDRLDRNCRILAAIQGDVRFLILQRTENKAAAAAFRAIFRNAPTQSCG